MSKSAVLSPSEENIFHALLLCRFGECGCDECPYRSGKGALGQNDGEFDCDDLLHRDAAYLIASLSHQVSFWKRRFEEQREKNDPGVAAVADAFDNISLFDGC